MVDWDGVVAVTVVLASFLLALGPMYAGFGFLSTYGDEMAVQDRAVEVEGTVTDTEIIPVDDNVDEDDDTDYRPSVEYRYTSDGETHLSRNARPARQGEVVQFPRAETRNDARDVLADYRVDSSVTVYVDPEGEYRPYLLPRSRVFNLDLWYALVLFGAGVLVSSVQISKFGALEMNVLDSLRSLRDA